jgi:hypothetical protein
MQFKLTAFVAKPPEVSLWPQRVLASQSTGTVSGVRGGQITGPVLQAGPGYLERWSRGPGPCSGQIRRVCHDVKQRTGRLLLGALPFSMCYSFKDLLFCRSSDFCSFYNPKL